MMVMMIIIIIIIIHIFPQLYEVEIASMWRHVMFRLLVVSSTSLALTWFLNLPRCSDSHICTRVLYEMPITSVRTWIWTAYFSKNSQYIRNRRINCFMRTDRPRSVVPSQCVSARLDRSQVGLFCTVSIIGSTPTYICVHGMQKYDCILWMFSSLWCLSCAPGRLPIGHEAGHVDTERPACACFRHAWSADVSGSDSRMISA
jgi:hypothetical protein